MHAPPAAEPDPGPGPTMQVRTRAYEDGPVLIRRDGKVIARCRCRRSELLPACDGSHRAAAFVADGFAGWDA